MVCAEPSAVETWRRPELAEVLANAHVVTLRLRTRFRGLTEREAVVFEGPYGWGEFAPFVEYDDAEAARWLAAGIEAAWAPPVAPVRDVVPVNATVPAVAASDVEGVLARFPGCTTAKVKVAQAGQNSTDDVARVREVRSVLGPDGKIRVDANGAWDVDTALAVMSELAPFGLEYAEQPCATVPELAELRKRLAAKGIGVPIAADESVRRADDPFAVAQARAADVIVVKVPPLGGVRATLALAQTMREQYGMDVVVSSALDTSVGLAAGVAAAAALPKLAYACGLGTAALLTDDVTSRPLLPVGGQLSVQAARETSAEGTALRVCAAPAERSAYWLARLVRCLAL